MMRMQNNNIMYYYFYYTYDYCPFKYSQIHYLVILVTGFYFHWMIFSVVIFNIAHGMNKAKKAHSCITEFKQKQHSNQRASWFATECLYYCIMLIGSPVCIISDLKSQSCTCLFRYVIIFIGIYSQIEVHMNGGSNPKQGRSLNTVLYDLFVPKHS